MASEDSFWDSPHSDNGHHGNGSYDPFASTPPSGDGWEDSDFSAGLDHASEPIIDPDHIEWENFAADHASSSVADLLGFVFKAIFGN